MYELTEKAREALRAWLAEPSERPRIHRTQALRLNHSLARRLIAGYRDWIDDVEAAYGADAAD